MIRASAGLIGGLSGSGFIPGFAAAFLCGWPGTAGLDSVNSLGTHWEQSSRTAARALGAGPSFWAAMSCSHNPTKSVRPSHGRVWGTALQKGHHGNVVPWWRGHRHQVSQGIPACRQADWGWCSWDKAGFWVMTFAFPLYVVTVEISGLGRPSALIQAHLRGRKEGRKWDWNADGHLWSNQRGFTFCSLHPLAEFPLHGKDKWGEWGKDMDSEAVATVYTHDTLKVAALGCPCPPLWPPPQAQITGSALAALQICGRDYLLVWSDI